MIRVAILYSNKSEVTFDAHYYRTKHLALVKQKYGPLGLRKIELDEAKTLEGPHKAPFHAIGYLFFDTTKDFMNAVKVAGKEVMADVANFTNSTPTIQVSEYSQI
jgi:uncharacterized protein (TIGR02118 family)